MITRLRGCLIEKHPPFLMLELNGALSYELQASMQTFYQLPIIGTEVQLYTHFLVREDGHYLYGFVQIEERRLFRELIRISGVGPKVALALLSKLETASLLQILAARDITALQGIPGIGPKTAGRLVLEMADRFEKNGWLPQAVLQSETAGVFSPTSAEVVSSRKDPSSSGTRHEDAIGALVSLGYRPSEARRWVHQADAPGLSLEALIRRALQSAR